MAGNKRLKWILSLLLGPVVFSVLLLVSPETPTIDEIMQKLTEFVFCLLILWIAGFALVWGLYALAGYATSRSRGTADTDEPTRETGR